MQIDGRAYRPRSAAEAMARGVFMSSKDRSANAVIPGFDIANNMALPFLSSFSRLSFLNAGRQRRAVSGMIDRLGVVCQSDGDDIATLSGGNQQKVVLARWLATGSKLFILDEPTVGVDIGAKVEIYQVIERLAAQGAGILISSSDPSELLGICDRIVVLMRGEKIADEPAITLNLDSLTALTTGGGSAGTAT